MRKSYSYKAFVLFAAIIFTISTPGSLLANLPNPAKVADELSVLQDQEIDAKTSRIIRRLNGEFLKAVKKRDLKAVQNMFWDKVQDTFKAPDAFEGIIQLSEMLKAADATLYHEFYIAENNSNFTASITCRDPLSFRLNFVSAYQTRYFSLFRLVQKETKNELLISLVYVLADGNWRLFSERYGWFKTIGKTAVDWFEEAKRYEDQKLEIAAALRLQMAASLLNPVPGFVYDEDAKIRKLGESVKKKVDRLFPIFFNEIKTNPKVFAASVTVGEGMLIPQVLYVTQIPFSDTVALAAEANAMKTKVFEKLPGINTDVKKMIFGSVQAIPTTEEAAKKTSYYKYVMEL